MQEILWLAGGVAIGVAAGLVPGIHPNTVASMALLMPFEKGTGFAIFIVAMSVANSIIDAIPSVLLGTPSEENVAGMLPSHRMLHDGRGMEAIMLMVAGSLLGAIFAMAAMPLVFAFALRHGHVFPTIIPVIVVASFCLMAWREGKKLFALAFGLLCGTLGVVALGKVDNAVFVLITGFFGVTGLLESIVSNPHMPRQSMAIVGKLGFRVPLLAALAGAFTSVFPGIGPTQATVTLGGTTYGHKGKDYIVLASGVGMANLVSSLLLLFAAGKGRSGMAVSLQTFVQPDAATFALLLCAATVAAGLSAVIAEPLSRLAIEKLALLDYRKASACVLVFLLAIVWLSAGPLGLLACATAAGIALFGIAEGLNRSQCMSFLLFPTILFYLGISL